VTRVAVVRELDDTDVSSDSNVGVVGFRRQAPARMAPRERTHVLVVEAWSRCLSDSVDSGDTTWTISGRGTETPNPLILGPPLWLFADSAGCLRLLRLQTLVDILGCLDAFCDPKVSKRSWWSVHDDHGTRRLRRGREGIPSSWPHAGLKGGDTHALLVSHHCPSPALGAIPKSRAAGGSLWKHRGVAPCAGQRAMRVGIGTLQLSRTLLTGRTLILLS
jgi:hypothetical protein